MNKLLVMEKYEKEIEYEGCMNDKCKKSKKRGCECGLGYTMRRFTAYSIKADDENYYKLKGFGAKDVKVGDEITGVIEEEAWEKDGKSGLSYTFVLPKKEEALKAQNEELKAELERLKKAEKSPNSSTEIDIPF